MEDKYTNYVELSKQIDEIVDKEMPEFQSFSLKKKIMKITSSLTRYVDAQSSACFYSKRERKNPRWKKEREMCEYIELITAARIRKGLQSLNEEELKLYVSELDTKFKYASIEKDQNKRYKAHDIIIAGCQLCNVEYLEIMSQLEVIKANSLELLKDNPTM